MKTGIFIFSLFFYIVLFFAGDLSGWENLSVSMFVYFFLMFLLNLGSRIVILDLMVLLAFVTCLLMPVLFYHVYTKDNPLALVWGKYMPISSDEYFSFALPAVFMLILGLKFPLGRQKAKSNPAVYLENVKQYLGRHPKLGLYLVATGVISGLLDFLAPSGLREVFFLMAHLVFVGVFYIFYSPNKNKRKILIAAVALMLGESLLTGMFGELIFISVCSSVLVLLGTKIRFRKKLGFAMFGIFVIILVQSVKGDYRKRTWHEQSGGDPIYFMQLVVEKMVSPSSMLDPMAMFVTSVRLNQGWLVATTMKMVPEKHPFGNGEPLLDAVYASVIPRLLWPDKPEAGGKANLKRFWGFDLIGWSTNIGTLGEAYANFDRTGGLFYMFFYGLFFNFALSRIFKLAERRPTLILWLPFLFFSVINVETDLLTTMGALVKSIIFTWIVFRAFDLAFNMKL
jgi:hypothetical protein